MSSSTSSNVSIMDQISASDPARCSSTPASSTTTVAGSHNNKSSKVTKAASSRVAKLKVQVNSASLTTSPLLPALGETMLDPRLHQALSPYKWEPSQEELNVAHIGARNAQAILRRLEASQTLWTSKLIAEMCDKHQMHDQQEVFTPIIPLANNEADLRIAKYRNAVQGCEKEIRGVKRALRGYACVFDRHHEFGDSGETTHSIESSYIFHGEHLGLRSKRQRQTTPQLNLAFQSDLTPEPHSPLLMEPHQSDKENMEPQYPGDSSADDSPSADEWVLLPGKKAVPKEERCTKCTDTYGPTTPHREENCHLYGTKQ
ncbi:hypothetical protein BGZ70_002732 [Mortierella alpina]|uniref:Uncharacterized protein n=1 Tax=Mortierella alpina TaxID=64518 RepID=A0A9P6IU57_MORAP|nr:hypothetical protein BGZ70_002732 [Mortierella alpina]